MSRTRLAALRCAVVLSCLGAAQAAGPASLPPAPDVALAREIFKELVEIDTTHAKGSTVAAQAIRKRLLAAGFQPEDVVLIAPAEWPAKGNLVVRYRGSNGRSKPVLFLGHLDVVDAKAEDWTVDPFKLTEKDGFLYGRGTIDMKDGIAALAETLIRLKRERFVPERDVIAAFTADEEAGGDADGPEFLLARHRELIDAELALSLDGGGGSYRNGQRRAFDVHTSQKVYLTFTLETTGPGGHGSLPGIDNPIYRLAQGLGRLEKYEFPVMLTATTRARFAKLADLDAGAGSADMRAVAKEPPDLAAAKRLSATPHVNAQLRTTCVATLISGGHAENALPQRAKATVQCRMIPGDTQQHVQDAIVTTLADPQIRVAVDVQPIVGIESPPQPKLFARLTRVIHSLWPGVAVVPTMAPGFGDARHLTRAGIPTYDLGGRWMDENENRAHGRDERIGVREFDEEVEYTYRLVREMSRP